MQIVYLKLDAGIAAVPGGLVQEILQRLQHLKYYDMKINL